MYKRYYIALSKSNILLTVQSIIITPSEKYDPQKALGTDRNQIITPIYACTNSINKNWGDWIYGSLRTRLVIKIHQAVLDVILFLLHVGNYSE